jgi:hypothetical protein
MLVKEEYECQRDCVDPLLNINGVRCNGGAVRYIVLARACTFQHHHVSISFPVPAQFLLFLLLLISFFLATALQLQQQQQ